MKSIKPESSVHDMVGHPYTFQLFVWDTVYSLVFVVEFSQNQNFLNHSSIRGRKVWNSANPERIRNNACLS